MPTALELKELEILHTPLILFDCELSDGLIERWSTHKVTFSGSQYAARVLRHNVFEMRWGAEDGIDSVSRISLTLANADSYASQIDRTRGLKGAKLTARFVFFDLKNDMAASTAMVLFRGLTNPPDEITETNLRLSAHNRLNLQRFLLPETRIQKRCPWTFPSNLAQREEALAGGMRGKYSSFGRCGYSADQAGGRGNLDGTEPFTSCDYTRTSCEQRGMFERDALGQATGRFGGVEFVPASILVRGHGESGFHASALNDNLARYNDFVPIHYGTVWTQPPVVFSRNDGNLTLSEVLLGMGEINRVLKVVVNGVEIAAGIAGQDMTATGWYNVISAGSASGAFNVEFTNASGTALGDPYGSMGYLSAVVPSRVSDGRSVPQVKVLLEGLRLSTYAEDGSFTGELFTANPAWVLLDLLRRSGWTTDEISIGSFARAANYCDELISVNDLYGNAKSVPRFQCNLTLQRRRSVADWIRGVRNGSRMYLVYGATGLLELRIEGALAIQQPALPDGSNASGEVSGGWPAYEFGDGTGGVSGILRRTSGESSVRMWHRSTAESANRVSVEFQDQFNEFQQDSLSLVDVDDAQLTRQEVSVNSTALGIPNFHQAARVLRLQLDRALRGNLFIEFETSVKALGLLPGDIVTFTYQKEGSLRALYRVTRVSPSVNYGRVLIEAQAHDDAWFSDEVGSPFSSRVSRRQIEAGVGLPRPLVGDTTNGQQGTEFGISESVTLDADGGGEVTLEAGFHPPQKPSGMGAEIPLCSLSPVVSTTGGTLGGGQTLFYGVTAMNADGMESGLSFLVRADLPVSTNTNKVALQDLSFSPGTAAFQVYRGRSPYQLLRIASGVAVAPSFEDGGLAAASYGPPDENYDHARFEWRVELHPEVTADSFSASTIGSSSLQLAANEFSGMKAVITQGKGAGQQRTIAAHDAHTLSLESNWAISPDATSRFVIAESSWKNGAVTTSSPAKITAPNRSGTTVQIVGVAVNAVGKDSGRELSPLTRWQIGGAAGAQLDLDVPPPPVYGLEARGQGTVALAGVAFTTLNNTRSISSGTLTLHYWDELASPSAVTLSADPGASSTEVALSSSGGSSPGSLIQVESEVMVVQAASGSTLTVTRGSHGTAAVPHAGGTAVFALARKVFIISFARQFFGSPASGSFSYPVFMPDSRIAAADLFVTNLVGNSETSKLNVTGTTDRGLRTLSGGQFSLQVDGSLAIQNDATPDLVVESAHSARDIFAIVQQAPTLSGVQMQVRQDSDVYCTLTIPAGETVSNVVNGFGLPPLQPLSKLHLDILAVPQAAESAPGSDLTVTIRL